MIADVHAVGSLAKYIVAVLSVQPRLADAIRTQAGEDQNATVQH